MGLVLVLHSRVTLSNGQIQNWNQSRFGPSCFPRFSSSNCFYFELSLTNVNVNLRFAWPLQSVCLWFSDIIQVEPKSFLFTTLTRLVSLIRREIIFWSKLIQHVMQVNSSSRWQLVFVVRFVNCFSLTFWPYQVN